MISQLLANGLIAASYYVLVGLGFGLIYSLSGAFNVCHAASFVIGPFTLFLLMEHGVPLAFAVVAGLLLAFLCGFALDAGVFRLFRRRGDSPLVLLLVSFGVYLAFQNLIALLFGDDARRVAWQFQNASILVLGAWVTRVHLWLLLSAVTACMALGIVWKLTAWGRTMRAVSSDWTLTRIVGMNPDGVVSLASGAAAVLAAGAGLLRGADVGIAPDSGFEMLIPALVAVLLGGGRSLTGITAGAIVLALLQQVSGWFLGEAWKMPAAYVILVVVLIARPSGLVSRRQEWEAPASS